MYNTSWRDFTSAVLPVVNRTIDDIAKNCKTQSENFLYSQSSTIASNNHEQYPLVYNNSHPCDIYRKDFLRQVNDVEKESRREYLNCYKNLNRNNTIEDATNCKKTAFSNYLQGIQKIEGQILSDYISMKV